MDDVNISHSASPSTSAVASNLVSNNTSEPSCIDIEVDFELRPIQLVESSFPSRASSHFEGFDGGDSVSNQGFDVEDSVFAQGFDGEDSVSAQLSPLLPFYPTENFELPQISQHRISWPRIAKVFVGFTLIIISGLLATLYFVTARGKPNLGCQINFIVSKDGTSNFKTVSQAVEASPSYSTHKVCIFIRTGEYQEMVNIGKEKINLILMGEGIGKTTISSNASIGEPVTTWPLATLRIIGKKFLAQDLTIINTAKYGVAVENWSEKSILFRCKLEGANATLHVKGKEQFYRSCHLYGKSNLVFGCTHAFFQKCEFFSEKSYPEDKIIFSNQSSLLSTYRSGFIFHLCAFYVVDKLLNSSEMAFLGSSLGNHALFVVMQSYLDASIGGYFLGTSPLDTTYYAIFDNVGRGATMAKIPPFVHILGDVKDASIYSLRVFLDGGNWIPPGVEYHLDLLK